MATQKKMFKKFSVVPKMWHGLKNVAMRFNVNVAFSTPVKIASICPGVQKRYEKMALDGHGGCGIAHGKRFVPCITNLVHQIPLSRGASYIGQRRVGQHKSERV